MLYNIEWSLFRHFCYCCVDDFQGLLNVCSFNLYLQSHDDRSQTGVSPSSSLHISRNSSVCGSFSGRFVFVFDVN